MWKLAIPLIALSSSVAHAGGWVPEPGHGYAKGWLRTQLAIGVLDGYHDDVGEFRYFGNYSETGIHGYVEIGVAPRLAVIAGWAPMKIFVMRQGSVVVVRPSDPTVGLRLGLVQREWVLSLQVDVTPPLVTSRSFGDFNEIDMDTGEVGERLGSLRVGSGVWTAEPRLQFGFGADKGWFGIEVGWRFRSGKFQDALVWLIEGGYRFVPAMRATVRISHVDARGASPPEDNEGSPSGVGNGVSYFGFAFEAAWVFGPESKQELGISVEGATFYVRQGGGPVFSAFVATSF